MDTEYNQKLKTPSYTLRAVRNYNKRNVETINLKSRQKYASMTPEEKANRILQIKEKKEARQKLKIQNSENNNQIATIKKPTRYSLMTPEDKETYKAKQRAYYQSRKLKQAKPIISEKE
jgi:seryl-tRNA(Sec) selenium transferase